MKEFRNSVNNFWLIRFVLYGLLAILVLLLLYFVQLEEMQVFPQVGGSPSSMSVTELPKSTKPEISAFPSANGYGTSTQSGRYGRILFVSNLNDTTNIYSPDYTGNLRWALEQTWANEPDNPNSQSRIVIFKVGGVISLVDTLIVRHPFVTIAGQTAPGDGITLKGATLTIGTHDVIMRGMRIRVGDLSEPSCCLDGII